jgi:hypothetical protein
MFYWRSGANSSTLEFGIKTVQLWEFGVYYGLAV